MTDKPADPKDPVLDIENAGAIRRFLIEGNIHEGSLMKVAGDAEDIIVRHNMQRTPSAAPDKALTPDPRLARLAKWLGNNIAAVITGVLAAIIGAVLIARFHIQH